MPPRRTLTPFCIALLLVAPVAAHAQEPSPQTEVLHACVAARAETLDFSGAVLISRKGQAMTYARGAQANGDPITSRSRFNIGSAGKMFTAVAVGQLVEKGQIDLDAPIGRHVDGLTAEASNVTVRQLLTHSSGLGNFFTPDNAAAIGSAKTLKELKPFIANDVPAFEPGSRFAYSNSGFLLLGLLIEETSGQAYDAYVAEHIFVPTGMTASSLTHDLPTASVQGMTSGVLPPRPPAPNDRRQEGSTNRPLEQAAPPSPRAPLELRPSAESVLPGTSAGGAFSTVEDLERFFSALQSGRLVKPETARLLQQKQIVSGPARGNLPELGYGFGFSTGSFEEHPWFGHSGGTLGVNSEAVAFPQDDAVVVVLANRDPPMAAELLRIGRRMMFTQTCPGLNPRPTRRAG